MVLDPELHSDNIINFLNEPVPLPYLPATDEIAGFCTRIAKINSPKAVLCGNKNS